jgi:hypothetical protein
MLVTFKTIQGQFEENPDFIFSLKIYAPEIWNSFMATMHLLPDELPCTPLLHSRVSNRWHVTLPLLVQNRANLQIPSKIKSETSRNSL